ncbi:MAG: FHA domain-containing protein, partial [Candidatus Theseobacter exili]|nr:FHA domain-containing protein [Candidatus Theseobacter exili]
MAAPMVCTIGRSDDCSIAIKADGKISRHHCQIEFKDNLISIKDLDSSNGVLVNEKKIDPLVSFTLVDDDEVLIGNSLLKVEFIKTQSVIEVSCINTNVELEEAAAEKTAAEKTAAEKTAAEKTAAEKTAAEKAATEKAAEEKAAAEKIATEKVAAEKVAAEKVAAEKTAAEKVAAEKAAAEQAAAEKAATEKTAAEKVATEKAAAEKAAAEKTAAEKDAAEKAAAEKTAAEKVAAEKDAAEKAAAEKVAAEKVAAEKVAAEKVAAEKSVSFDAPHNAKDVEDNLQNRLPPKIENKILDDQPKKETDQTQTVNKKIVVNKSKKEIDQKRFALKIENIAFGNKPKKKINQNKPAKEKISIIGKFKNFWKKINIIEKFKNFWKKVNIIERSKNFWKKLNIIGKFKNFWKEISTIANQTSSLVALEKTQHDNEKIENDEKYDKEKMLHIIEGTYKPVHLNQLLTKEEFNLTDFILNVIFWLTEKVHSGTCLLIKYVKAFLQCFFSKVSWSMRFAFMLTLLGTFAIAIGEFGADKYISMSGFDGKQVKLLQSTGILSSFNLFSTLSIYVGCLMLVSILVLRLKNRISLLFLKISAAAFGVITLWTLL